MGPDGPVGPTGADGAAGPTGAAGAAGAEGPVGADGAAGAAGAEGPVGPGSVIAGRSDTVTSTLILTAGTWRVSTWVSVSTNDQALIECVLLIAGETPVVTAHELQPPSTTVTYASTQIVTVGTETEAITSCSADREDGIQEPASVIAATLVTGG
ncbi:MAG: hypothetical protein JHC71_16140 [Blastococcus sp.]|nr:hypothetical protein [Blastococcus sp.]